MKNTILVFSLLFFSPLMSAKTVQSLDKVAGQIKSKEITQQYDNQMNGTPMPDEFGYLTREDERVQTLLDLLAPNAKRENLGQVSLRKWRDNQYIAVICQNSDPIKHYDWNDNSRYSECRTQYSEKGDNPVEQITLAIITLNAEGKPMLLAEPYTERYAYAPEGDFRINLISDNLDKLQFTLYNHAENLVVGELDRLDFANYQLNKQMRAFGVRFVANVGYSGGGASNQSMALFSIIDGKLKPILNVPTYSFSDIAGEWNEDGTRQHDVNSTEYILMISSKQHDGFNDIIWHETNNKKPEKKTFRWDNKAQYYK